MRRAMIGVFLAAFAVGCVLIIFGGWWLLAVGVVSILCGIAYTGGPYPLAYIGLGDVFSFLFFGVVAVMFTYFVQAGAFTMDAFLISVAVGLLVSNILLVNNYRDLETDLRAGKRTLVVRFGRRFARWQYHLSYLVAFLIPVLLWRRGYGAYVILPLLLWPLAVRLRMRLRRARSGEEFNRLLAATARFLVVFTIVLAAGLVAGR
jgi:1,4-dihydroxy-2-naphthoate octaprenyltransferase